MAVLNSKSYYKINNKALDSSKKGTGDTAARNRPRLRQKPTQNTRAAPPASCWIHLRGGRSTHDASVF